MDGLDKNHCIVLKDGLFDTENGTTAGDLRKIFDLLDQAENKPILLHFHGGLVDNTSDSF